MCEEQVYVSCNFWSRTLRPLSRGKNHCEELLLSCEDFEDRVAVGAQSSTFPDPLFSSGAFLIMPRSIFDLGVQTLIDGSTFDLKSIAGKPALAMNVASR